MDDAKRIYAGDVSETSFKTQLFEALYGCADVEQGVNSAIAMIGRRYGVSRVYIFENDADNRFGDNTFEWCAAGIEPQIDSLQHMSYEEYGYYDLFDQNGLFFCPDVQQLPELQRELLSSQGICATLQFALYDKGNFRGFIGFDDCVKTRDDWLEDKQSVTSLVFLAKLLSVYLIKERNLQTALDYRRAMEQALEQAQTASRAKSEFLSNMSHDIRTPLNAILNLTALAKTEIGHPELLLADLDKISVSGAFLLGLINDILDMSRIESGSVELTPEVYPYSEFEEYVDSVIAPLCVKKDIQLLWEKASTNLDIRVDRTRFNQIIFNLLSNAIKYTPDGGTVRLRLESNMVDKNLLDGIIQVIDTGKGMSEEFQQRMFKPFEREDTSGAYTGTGLGLAITKTIVEKMDGTISVESKLGQGTTVKVRLPLPIATERESGDYQKQKRAQHAIRSATGADECAGQRILVAEDHPLNQEIICRLLKRHGVLTECAENGALAVEKFAAQPAGYYQAILMDVRMPVMDGLAAARAIRALERPDAKQIPIIAMTANAFASDISASTSAGMNAHLSKPVNAAQLIQTLRDLTCDPERCGKPKIIVVDDVEVNAAVVAESLQANYRVLLADGGENALNLLRENVDVVAVITDLQMPGMSGAELVAAIRAQEKYDAIAILANTQFGDPGQEEQLLEIGADDFIYKPTTPKILMVRLESVLMRHQKI